jgi:alpha-beta hydrolase superfamily lysophospholipase
MRRLLVLLAIAGCAHSAYLELRPDPAPPAGSTTFELTATDGTKLLARQWAATGDAKAVVVIMHGLKDHSARYATLATRLVAAGYSVYAFDLRGHGRSAGPRVAPDDWMDYVADLEQFLKAVEGRELGKRVYLFGHSMGGAIAARAAELHAPQLAGLLLSGPALAIDAPPLLVALTRMAAFANPRAPALKLPNEDFSSTPGAAAATSADELVSQPPGPARTAAGLVEGMHAIWSDVDRLTLPLLAMHGTKDRLTAPSGSRALIEAAPSTDKTLRIYDGFWHDLLHEPDHARVEADIISWLDVHVDGAAVAPPPVYTGHLDGDPRGWTQAIELAGGIARSTDGGGTYAAGTFALSLARPRPLGWHGALTARRVAGGYSIALRPIGIALRSGATMIGVSGGVSLLTDTELGGTAGATLEQPLGPLHIALHADLERPFASGSAFTTWVAGTLRLGGDRAYWPHARAGIGPAVTGGYQCTDGACGFAALLGLQMYGVD